MEKVASLRGGPEVVRRTAPLKVLIALLYRELEGAKSDATIGVDRALFESVITTLECVVEDIEVRGGGKSDDRRVVESNAGAPRLTAPRV